MKKYKEISTGSETRILHKAETGVLPVNRGLASRF